MANLQVEDDSVQMEAPGNFVGAEVKHLRKAKGLTIAQLAAQTELSVGHISQIERGLSRPSFRALMAISRALGVTISWFFPPQGEDGDDLRDIVVRAEARRTLTFKSGIRDELLSPDLGRQLELLRSVFPPRTSSGSVPYRHKGEEAGFILKGELTLWVGPRELRLQEGDSFAFSSEEDHRYENPTDRETVVIWAITPPSY